MAINTTLVANTIQPKYSKKLLEKAIQLTILIQFAMRQSLPRGAGNNSIRFFRPESANLAAVGAPAALTEGVAPTNYRDPVYTPIDVPLSQRGQVLKITDIANTVGLLEYLKNGIELMGEEFALDVDTLLRNTLSHATTGLSKRYAQGKADFATLAAATLANGCIVPQDLLDAQTRLKLNRAPKINGKYVMAAPPQLTRDILNNAEFRDVVKQQNADRIFKGEVGEYYDLKIVEHTNPFQQDETEGTYAATFNAAGTNTTGLIYDAYILGAGAFGCVDLATAGSSPDKKPQIIINDGPDKTDPLNQFTVVGWKAYFGQLVLNPNFGITLRAKTQFAG